MSQPRIDWMKDTRKSILRLRDDAVARGADDLARMYGWSALRLSNMIIAMQMQSEKE